MARDKKDKLSSCRRTVRRFIMVAACLQPWELPKNTKTKILVQGAEIWLGKLKGKSNREKLMRAAEEIEKRKVYFL